MVFRDVLAENKVVCAAPSERKSKILKDDVGSTCDTGLGFAIDDIIPNRYGNSSDAAETFSSSAFSSSEPLAQENPSNRGTKTRCNESKCEKEMPAASGKGLIFSASDGRMSDNNVIEENAGDSLQLNENVTQPLTKTNYVHVYYKQRGKEKAACRFYTDCLPLACLIVASLIYIMGYLSLSSLCISVFCFFLCFV